MKIPLVLACILASPAFAQPEADAGFPVDPAAPTEAAAPEPANTLQPDTERIGFLQGKVEALEEQFAASDSVLSSLSRIKSAAHAGTSQTWICRCESVSS